MTVTPKVQALQVRPGQTLHDVLPFTNSEGTTTTRENLHEIVEICKIALTLIANQYQPDEWETEIDYWAYQIGDNYAPLFIDYYMTHDGNHVGVDISMPISNEHYEIGSIQVVVELP